MAAATVLLLVFVSVILPIRNEAPFIEEVLRAVLAQDYPRDLMEIIVADGQSHDGTREIVNALAAQDGRLRLIENPDCIIPTGLNRAIRVARGEVIVRVDGHGVIPPNYIRECVAYLLKMETGQATMQGTAHRSRNSKIAAPPARAFCSFVAVGGAWDCVGRGSLGRVIALATSSPFGVGNAQYRTTPLRADPRTQVRGYGQAPVATDSVPFWAVRRRAFEQIGLFREEMPCHEDYEWNYRLRRAGGQIFLLPWLRSRYYVRSTLGDLARQYWRYGFWKGRFLRSHPESLKSRHLIPPLLVAILVFSFLASLAAIVGEGWGEGAQIVGRAGRFSLATLLGVYLGFLLLASSILAFRSSGPWSTSVSPVAPRGSPEAKPIQRSLSFLLSLFLILPVVFATLHLGWGAGVWFGLLRGPVPGRPPRL